jgi:hypothetical protein
MNRWWWVVLASGCGGGVHTSKDAPFDVKAVKSAIWSEGGENDAQYQSALLLLSTEKIECGAVEGKPVSEVLDELTRAGSGLWFGFEQVVADGGAALEWTGTWMADGDLPGSEIWGYRSIEANAFETGVIYGLPSDDGPWVRLDEVEGEGVKGEFWTPFWRGRFDAESCGAWIYDTTTTTTTVDTGF